MSATTKDAADYKLKISISISPRMLAKLDREVAELESTRSAVIATALRKHLK